MPPKVKFQKEEIIQAAVAITRERGIAAVTAREVGAVLGVSSRPLFTYFDSVDELKREVYHYAKNLYQEYVKEGLTAPIPFLGVGQNYIRFAKEEPELYKYLFLNAPGDVKGSAMEVLKLSQELVRESLMRIYHMDGDTADKYFRDLWLVRNSVFRFVKHTKKFRGFPTAILIKMPFLENLLRNKDSMKVIRFLRAREKRTGSLK